MAARWMTGLPGDDAWKGGDVFGALNIVPSVHLSGVSAGVCPSCERNRRYVSTR
jgi:hypothetical protein